MLAKIPPTRPFCPFPSFQVENILSGATKNDIDEVQYALRVVEIKNRQSDFVHLPEMPVVEAAPSNH